MSGSARLRADQKLKGGGNYNSHAAIQTDWDNRDFVETIELNIMAITDFLNRFERTTKSKLAMVNGKMSKVRCLRMKTIGRSHNICSLTLHMIN
jgi:hypothetical protein